MVHAQAARKAGNALQATLQVGCTQTPGGRTCAGVAHPQAASHDHNLRAHSSRVFDPSGGSCNSVGLDQRGSWPAQAWPAGGTCTGAHACTHQAGGRSCPTSQACSAAACCGLTDITSKCCTAPTSTMSLTSGYSASSRATLVRAAVATSATRGCSATPPPLPSACPLPLPPSPALLTLPPGPAAAVSRWWAAAMRSNMTMGALPGSGPWGAGGSTGPPSGPSRPVSPSAQDKI